jgi:hypothetical protein
VVPGHRSTVASGGAGEVVELNGDSLLSAAQLPDDGATWCQTLFQIEKALDNLAGAGQTIMARPLRFSR